MHLMSTFPGEVSPAFDVSRDNFYFFFIKRKHKIKFQQRFNLKSDLDFESMKYGLVKVSQFQIWDKT